MLTDREKRNVMNPYYKKVRAKLFHRMEKRTLMKMPPAVVLRRRKVARSECTKDETAHGCKEVKQAASQSCKEWRKQNVSKDLMVKMDVRVFNINIVILALCLQRFTPDIILNGLFPCVFSIQNAGMSVLWRPYRKSQRMIPLSCTIANRNQTSTAVTAENDRAVSSLRPSSSDPVMEEGNAG